MSKVLVIDDDRSVSEMVHRSLEKINVSVEKALTAERGLEMLQEFKIDTVLLDIMLPGTSGLDVFHRIRDFDRKLPVIFITSGTDSATAIKAMQLGGFDYVT
ncbi:MAG TPA: response regulator, partial [Planctomycetaceae bacterium]|nr:response regulator [Planctomycetaceae bacterium]